MSPQATTAAYCFRVHHRCSDHCFRLSVVYKMESRKNMIHILLHSRRNRDFDRYMLDMPLLRLPSEFAKTRRGEWVFSRNGANPPIGFRPRNARVFA